MSHVSLRGIAKKYQDAEVLKGVDLEIAQGEFMVLVGPSGCGKSTLLRMVAGLEEITQGEISIGGRVVNALPPRERGIAMVFQDYALYPHMSVAQNMSFGLRLRGLPKQEIEARVEEAASILRIESLLSRMPRALSGGQRQRVAIGRAIVRKPEVFLFDEPLSNLDAKLREEMRVEIAKLHQSLRATVIYVTHDQVEAMTLASRIAVMNGGLLQQVGAPAEVFSRPANRFTAGFIGSPAMNFIEGGLLLENGEACFRSPAVNVTLSREPENFDPKLSGSRSCTLGIRPDDIQVRSGAPSGEGEFAATVEVSELLGRHRNLYVRTGEARFLAVVGSEFAAKPGEAVSLRFPPERLHLFDAQGVSVG